MNKLILATPKKLLLATSIMAMSSTAMAATSDALDSAKTDTLTVLAHYVTPLTMSLDLATIDFGDVYTDSVITKENVVASLTGELNETFTYTVSSDGPLVLLDTGSTGVDISGTSVIGGTLGAGVATFNFDVGLDTAALTAVANADTAVSEIITVTVQYNAIAGTTTAV
ncbi:MAG: hypothetical protein ACI9YH_000412 [Colwellia sp.]|jgi:hypothetical protein